MNRFPFPKPLHWKPFNVRHGLNNGKRKIISRKGASVDAHEKKQTPTLSHWDSLPCNTWHLKYTFNNKKKGKTQTQGKASVCKKRQTWRVSAPMESRHVGWIDSCVYSFCSCATSVPRHNLTSWPLCWSIYHQEASHTRQAIPTEPMQEPEFVVPLCNAVTGLTWKTDWCSVQLCVKCNHRWAVEEYWSYM